MRTATPPKTLTRPDGLSQESSSEHVSPKKQLTRPPGLSDESEDGKEEKKVTQEMTLEEMDDLA